MKSWAEKLDRPAKLVTIRPKFQKRYGRGKMLVPAPRDVEALIRKTPRGKLTTSAEIGDKLAHAAGAKCSCPMTTGIFIWMIAQAAEANARAGKSRITPYWRVVRPDGSLNEKFPGGLAAQADYLEAEGHTIDRSGKLRVIS